jgi:signal transduction histidine kinase
MATVLVFYISVLYGSHGISNHALSELREDFRHYFGIPLILVILFSGAIGWLMARRALAGVEEVTRAAADISKGDFDRRVPKTGRNDEIDRLADSFNTMVARTQALIGQMREITENIAHDLRSPITRMRGMAEMALSNRGADEEELHLAGLIIQECDRLLDLINTTLDISEAEAGLVKLDRGQIDLTALVRDLAELFQPSAEEKGIGLRTLGVEAPVTILADRRKLQRVFANLLDNALKYTPQGGEVTIEVTDKGGDARVVVDDTGAGVPDEDLPYIFDRFFRGEKSRSTPGNGLGLSLALVFTRVHGGTLVAGRRAPHGARFVVTLPKSLPSDA